MRNSTNESLYSVAEQQLASLCVSAPVWLFIVVLVECLQAVNSQFLEEVIIGLKFGARNFEVRGGEIQDLVGSLFKGFHKSGIKKPAPILPGNGAGVRLRQVRMRAGVFDELAQPLHHGRLRKEFAENVNLAA